MPYRILGRGSKGFGYDHSLDAGPWGSKADPLDQGRHVRLGLLPLPSVADYGPQGPMKRRRADLAQVIQEYEWGESMKRSLTVFACGLVLALSLPSWAQETKQLPPHKVSVSGTIETIDNSRRLVNLKTAAGKSDTIYVPKSVERFGELKVGDKLTATYNDNVSVRLKPEGEAAVDTGTTAKDATATSGTITEHRVMTATVDSIDKDASAMTFVGPNGWKYSRHIVDPSVFDKVKVGDKLDITWDADTTLSVEKP